INIVDRFNVKSYDTFDGRGNHASMPNGFSTVDALVNGSDLPSTKVAFGIPSYALAINTSVNAHAGYGSTAGTLGKYGNIVRGFEYIEDGIPKSSDAYLNGYALTRDKVLLAITANLNGVVVPELLSDAPYSYEYSLIKAIGETVAYFSK
ncbi:MAG: hypothetical protein LBN25_01655, partial [Christensenellaceae bacterium]|nr:hypothetical protein [Christensenellaceae bacterium]